MVCFLCGSGFSETRTKLHCLSNGIRCGHCYHQSCLLRWLRREVRGNNAPSPFCPICKQVLTSLEAEGRGDSFQLSVEQQQTFDYSGSGILRIKRILNLDSEHFLERYYASNEPNPGFQSGNQIVQPASERIFGDRCTICLTDFEENQDHTEIAVPVLSNGECIHYNHLHCLMQWCEQCVENGQAPRCPLCRRRIRALFLVGEGSLMTLIRHENTIEFEEEPAITRSEAAAARSEGIDDDDHQDDDGENSDAQTEIILRIPETTTFQQNDARNMVCNICDRTFLTRSGLWKHKRYRHRIGEFNQCSHCIRSYASSQNLRRHMANFHNIFRQ